MAQASETRTSYPRIPANNWWELRRRLKQTVPREVNASYLQTVLALAEGAARNVLRSLRAVGLVDEGGRLTERAMRWREDDQYADVCEEMRQEIYPQGLLDALPPPNPDRAQLTRWFAREAGTGQAAASQMAALYLMMAEADPTGANRTQEGPTRNARSQPNQSRTPSTSARSQRGQRDHGQSLQRRNSSTTPEQPTLHLTVQVHIDATASPEQIDQVFASMARHLYRQEE